MGSSNCPYCRKDFDDLDIPNLIMHTCGNCLPKGDPRK